MKFNMTWVALAEITPFWYSDILAWPFNRCYCVKSGHATLHTHDGDIEMVPGCIYILPSGYPCGYSTDGEMYKIFSHFKMMRFDIQDVFSKVKRPIVLKDKEAVIDGLIEAYKSADLCGAAKIYSGFYGIVAEAIEQTGLSGKDFPEYSLTVRQALFLIKANCRIDLSAEELAEKMNISPVNLQRQFKRKVCLPLGQYIRERVMEAAASELTTGTLSIGAISEKYGFYDQFYFSKTFKKYFGIQPSAYRKNHLS